MLKEMFRRDTGHDDAPPSHKNSASSHEVWLDKRIVNGRRQRYHEELRIGPSMASAMLGHNTANFRNINQAVVADYARMMTEGRWEDTVESLSFDRDGILQNGQHRLRAIIKSGSVVPFVVWFGCDPTNRKVIDQGRKRNLSQILASRGVPQACNVAALGALLDFVTKSETANDPNAMDRYISTLNASILAEAIKAGGRKSIRRLAPGAALSLAFYWIRTHSAKDAAAVHLFWDRLESGNDLPKKSPVLSLRDKLADTRHLPNTRGNTVLIAGKIVAAWNAVITRRAASTFETADGATLPKVI